jgi:hypothetical protein
MAGMFTGKVVVKAALLAVLVIFSVSVVPLEPV